MYQVQYVIFTDTVAVKMGTAVQILNIGEHCFYFPRHPRLDVHVGCQIEDTQQEKTQLTMEGDNPYTVS